MSTVVSEPRPSAQRLQPPGIWLLPCMWFLPRWTPSSWTQMASAVPSSYSTWQPAMPITWPLSLACSLSGFIMECLWQDASLWTAPQSAQEDRFLSRSEVWDFPAIWWDTAMSSPVRRRPQPGGEGEVCVSGLSSSALGGVAIFCYFYIVL